MTRRRLAVLPILLALGVAIPAWAAHPDEQIVLPGATSAEGIARGDGSTFYAGDLFAGDIFRGNVRSGTAELFIDAPDDGRMAVGMAFDRRQRLLFVAGGGDGTGHVYDTPPARWSPTMRSAPSRPSSTTSPSRRTAPGSPIRRRPPVLRPDRPR